MKYKAIIFDMDGTLVDSLSIWDEFWSFLGRRFRGDDSFRPTEEDDKAIRTLTLALSMDMIHKNYGLGESGSELYRIAQEYILNFYTTTAKLKPGVKEFLEACRKEGVKTCIASATAPDLIRVALKHCEIDEYFPKIFSCSEIGKGKEFPDVFLLAQKDLGEKLEDTWVFEDSAVAIQTAAKAGMKTVGIYDRYNYGQDLIRKTADRYLEEGVSFTTLLKD